MRVQFSTDGVPAQLRLAAWRDYYAEQVCSLTPVDADFDPAFRAEASGHVCGSFALLDVQAGLVRIRRTRADVARDQKQAMFVHRFRRPMLWKMTPIGAPLAPRWHHSARRMYPLRNAERLQHILRYSSRIVCIQLLSAIYLLNHLVLLLN